MLNDTVYTEDISTNKKPMIVIMGATATGKTSLAIEVAKRYSTEIISADSMLVYRGMDIGTAKPTIAEMQGIPHHMIDVVEHSAEYSVAGYADSAHSICREISQRQLMPVVVGGTGQYINAMALGERYLPSQRDDVYKLELEELYRNNGAEYMHSMLAELDAEAAKNIHPNNVKRVIRAIEIRKMCSDGEILPSESRYIDHTLGFSPFIIGLDYTDRQLHKELMHRRVDKMLENGLVDEVSRLLPNGFSKTAGQAIGYKEIVEFLYGNISLDMATENIKRATVRYAKRQRTWFSRLVDTRWYHVDEYDEWGELLERVFCDIDEYLSKGWF